MSIQSNKIMLNIITNDTITVKGNITPITLTQNDFQKEWEELANFRIAEPEREYTTSTFQSFLPNESISVGDVWQIDEAGVMELLRQIHPNPNLKMSINTGDSCGLWACLRAYNDEFVDIQFRLHAEFIFDDGRFTPSQFTGNLIINRIQQRVDYFKMYVPEGTVNFDVAWRKYPDKPYSIIDSGFCSQMELHSGSLNILEDTEFTESISQDEANKKLMRCFYKFEEINWVSFEEAIDLAKTQQKPIHVISIDGPLKDESC